MKPLASGRGVCMLHAYATVVQDGNIIARLCAAPARAVWRQG